MNINWRSIPFVRMILPFVGGIGLSMWYPQPSAWMYGALGGLLGLLLALWWRDRHRSSVRFWGVLGLLLVLLGWMRGSQYDERLAPHHFTRLDNYERPYGEWRVSVESMPESRGKWVRFVGAVQQLDSHAVTGRIWVSLAADSAANALRYGDELLLLGAPQPVAPPRNPHQFSYARYLHFQNLHFQHYAQPNDWLCLSQGGGWRVLRTMYAFRRMSLAAMEERLRPSTFAVGAALVLGDKSHLDEDLQRAYADTGAIHVLAVSGLHVGIVALVLNFLLGRIITARSRLQWIKVVLVILGLWSFALLTGAAPSVLRATTMFTFLTIGIYNRTPSSIYNNLAVSAFLLLAWNPYLLMAVGFQLSYCAVLGIVYFQPKIYRLWYAPNRVLDYVWQLTAVSIGAQLGTLPLSLLYFHQFPLLFFVSGLIVIPLATVILSLGLLLIAVAPWWSGAADVVGWCMDRVLWAQNEMIEALGAVPMHKLEGIWLSSWDVALLVAVIVGLILGVELGKRDRRWRWMAPIGLCLLGVSQLGQLLWAQHGQTVAVYAVRGGSGLSVTTARQTVFLVSDTSVTRGLGYAAEAHLWALRSEEVGLAAFAERLQRPELAYNGAVLSLRDWNMLVWHRDMVLREGARLDVDAVWITRGARVDWALLRRSVNGEPLVIVDDSFWRASAEELVAAGEAAGFRVHWTLRDGAWVWRRG